jgi:hypothetical protein
MTAHDRPPCNGDNAVTLVPVSRAQCYKLSHTGLIEDLDLHVWNVSSVRIDSKRARVDCAATVNLDSDGPTDVMLLDCAKAEISRTSVPR